jgi:uncharacterized protein
MRGTDGTGRGVAVAVTGASSGIGAATARLLGARGWSVALVARRAERLAEVARDVEAAGGRALVAAIDAADGAAVDAMAARVVSELGLPDAVVNSAGAGVWRWMEDTSHDELGRLLDAPFLAAWNTTRAFLPACSSDGRASSCTSVRPPRSRRGRVRRATRRRAGRCAACMRRCVRTSPAPACVVPRAVR